jgi:lipoic acid synthetase
MAIPHYKKVGLPRAGSIKETLAVLKKYHLNTVCEEASCPNKGECFAKKTATFLILGDVCTRNCAFCGVKKGIPTDVINDEPERIAKAVEELCLQSVVITSPTRDDLEDEGAGLFIRTVNEIRKLDNNIKIELLIPDFSGREELVDKVINSKPDVIAHNIETIERLYPIIRPKADYNRSIKVLERISVSGIGVCKSGFMLGLGECGEELENLAMDLKESGCEEVVVGQYLRSDLKNYEVQKYYSEEEFIKWRDRLLEIGFKNVLSSPLARTSYSWVVKNTNH